VSAARTILFIFFLPGVRFIWFVLCLMNERLARMPPARSHHLQFIPFSIDLAP
jgi:hypothetical protein